MKYQWKINDSEIDVDLEKKAEGEFTATIDDTAYTVWGHRLGPNQLYAEINGRGYNIAVTNEGTVREVSLHGIPYTVEDRSVRRRSSGGDQPTGDITPPMPGSIVRVLVAEGDVVAAGQELIVLSAMKMETTLYAPFAATVDKILVGEGDQVNAGQQLFELTQIEAEGDA